MPLCLLLLSPGEFLQGLHFLFELGTGLLALTAFDGLVLVLEFVEFKLEDIGEVVRSLATTTTTTTAAAALLPLTDLYLITLLGLMEILKRFQLG